MIEGGDSYFDLDGKVQFRFRVLWWGIISIVDPFLLPLYGPSSRHTCTIYAFAALTILLIPYFQYAYSSVGIHMYFYNWPHSLTLLHPVPSHALPVTPAALYRITQRNTIAVFSLIHSRWNIHKLTYMHSFGLRYACIHLQGICKFARAFLHLFKIFAHGG